MRRQSSRPLVLLWAVNNLERLLDDLKFSKGKHCLIFNF
jgi:hypothetical protein